MSSPTIGDPLPEFSLPRDGGGTVSKSDYTGQKLVLYFYPKDDTPGCTKEAIGFTEMADEFAKAGAAILGVSKDSVSKHDKFITKHDLKIPLASDENGSLCEDLGVWVEKSMYGKTYMGIERATFVIDGDGTIVQDWRKVRVPGHVEAVLEFVKGM